MADKKDSKTPLYDKSKKYHDLIDRIKNMRDEKYFTNLEQMLHHHADNYIEKNKGDDGKVHFNGDVKKHREFTDSMWEKAADHIAKEYLHMTDQQIKDLKKPTPDGEDVWENMMSRYIGGMDKEAFFENVKDQEEMSINHITEAYTKPITGRHHQYRHTQLLKKSLTEVEDVKGVEDYISMAKGHNKKDLKEVKKRKLKGIEDAIDAFGNVASHLQHSSYHPDKPDTYK
jgi:hypothetical protein